MNAERKPVNGIAFGTMDEMQRAVKVFEEVLAKPATAAA